jgi:beta-lactam-binding protein with PASTA domain
VYIVPDFNGQTVQQIKDQNFEDFFILSVIDSVYDKRREKGTVIQQHPFPGSRVKQGRHVYLTIVSESPELVALPNLKNLSLRQALVTLESIDLHVGNLDYVDYFARNAIVDQVIDNEPVEPGTEVLVGSSLDLIVGKGPITTGTPIPVLISRKQSEAIEALHYAYLNMGKQYFTDGDDTAHARVFKTDPSPLSGDLLPLGATVDVWYRSDEHFDFDNYLQQFVKDSLAVDTLVNQHIIRR